jgi:hypothetical protein
VREPGLLFYIGAQMAHNCRIDRAKLGGLQGKLVVKSSYRAHVDQRLPYDTLHLDDASMSYIYLELMY